MFRSPQRIFQMVAVLFVLIGCGLLAGAFFSYRNTTAFLRVAKPATGHVIGYERHNDNEGAISYYPVISYTPPGEQEIEFTASAGGSSRPYRIDAEVPVLYDPAQPFNADIDHPTDLWLAAIILGFMGVVFAGLGCFGFWYFRSSGVIGQLERTQVVDEAIWNDPAWNDMHDDEDQDDDETPTNDGVNETVKVI